jgi:GTP-binding protein HflX
MAKRFDQPEGAQHGHASWIWSPAAMNRTHAVERRERVLLLGFLSGRSVGEDDRCSAALEELQELARSAGVEVVGQLTQHRSRPDPATLFGLGKLEEARRQALERGAAHLVVDRELTPVQHRNIERLTGLAVMDRTQLILRIFARHARSREGQLQVELAQLTYLLPRLVGHGTDLSRLGGGIGTRGPGEQKLENQRRRIRQRIRKIEQALEAVRREREVRRSARRAVPLAVVALVGYTNAGKSTLFNALTRAGVVVSDRMFATLDPTLRLLHLPSHRRVLLSDTVGFIRDLPAGLRTAFCATLEELYEATLLLHVIDASSSRALEQTADVERLLRELELDDRPRLRVYNKIDRLGPEERNRLLPKSCGVAVSAVTGEGLAVLLEQIDRMLPLDPLVELEGNLSPDDSHSLALLQSTGHVLACELRDSQLWIHARVPRSVAARIRLRD